MSSTVGFRLLRGGLNVAMLGGIGLGVAYVVAPGPTTGLLNDLRGRLAWTPATCQMAPVHCLADRIPALQNRQAEVAESRALAEQGLRAIENEDRRQRNLLDANLGQQALLRSRTNEAMARGLERVSYLSRSLSMADVELQASSLAAEQAQFEQSLSVLLPPRRAALARVRQEAVLMENRIATALATVEAELALARAGHALQSADRLIGDIAGVERAATQAVGQVRSTLELVQAQRSAEPARGSASAEPFDFTAWRNGRAAGG